jgi:DNA 3'-phosphatase
MGNDKIMYRFHSANQFTSQKSSIDEVSTANADKHDGYDVIAFDMDSTIIKTKSGKAFPTNDNDWTLLYASIKDTVQHLHRQHIYLAIISNQGGVKQQKISREGLQRKVDRIVEYLGINQYIAL